MPLKLNYKTGLTLFYNLLRSEHEATTGFNEVKDKVISGIKPPDNVRTGEKSIVPGKQLKSIMAILRVCSHAKRVKAVAWVKREMLINAHVLVEDSPIYRKVMDEFQISEKEVNQAMVKLYS